MTICCYQTVKKALTQNEKVIIVTNRRCKWPFFLDKIKLYDFADIFLGEDIPRVALHNFRGIKDYIRYRLFLSHLDKVVESIVLEEDFLFYMPSMSLDMTRIFAYNKYCKGYYYVDEGLISYETEDVVNKMFSPKLKNATKRLFRIEEHCHFEINSTFIGTISISREAFPWNIDKVKIVNSIDDYVLEVESNIPVYDDVIVTSYFQEDVDVIIKGIGSIIDYILDYNRDSKIGIKIHPHSITYNREKTLSVLNIINRQYGSKVSIISDEVSIEAMSLVYHPNLFSLFSLSSLLLYGVLFKSSNGYFVMNDNNNISIISMVTFEDFFKTAEKYHLLGI